MGGPQRVGEVGGITPTQFNSFPSPRPFLTHPLASLCAPPTLQFSVSVTRSPGVPIANYDTLMAIPREILNGHSHKSLRRHSLRAYLLPEGGVGRSHKTVSISRRTLDISTGSNTRPNMEPGTESIPWLNPGPGAEPQPPPPDAPAFVRRLFPITTPSVLARRLFRRYGVPSGHHAHLRSHAPHHGASFVLSLREIAILEAIRWFSRYRRLWPTRADLARAINIPYPCDLVPVLASLLTHGLIARHRTIRPTSPLASTQHPDKSSTSFLSMVSRPKGPPGFRYRLATGALFQDIDRPKHPLQQVLGLPVR